jgi:hypothetical protein
MRLSPVPNAVAGASASDEPRADYWHERRHGRRRLSAIAFGPGSNITGISLLSPELDGKRQDILIEAVPGIRRMAAMVDSNVTPPYHVQTLQHAARSRGVELVVVGVSRPEETVTAIESAKAFGAEAINFFATPLFSVPGSQNNLVVMESIAKVQTASYFSMARNSRSRCSCWLWATFHGRVASAGADCGEDPSWREPQGDSRRTTRSI